MTRNTWQSGGAHSLQFQTQHGLHIEATTDSASPLISEFYELYDQAFVLPSEKEDLAGFVECLRLNEGAAYRHLSDELGAFAEPLVVVRDPASGRVVAGANFLVSALRTPRPLLSMNLNYIFVDSAQRRTGIFGRLLRDLNELAGAFFRERTPDTLPLLVFIEQNDPQRMDPAAYALDTAHSGLDQVDRLHIWSRHGARLIDYPYVQPPLGTGAEADPNLLYAVLGVKGAELDACTLLEHLRRFFAISIYKGRDFTQETIATEQLHDLEQRCKSRSTIALRKFE